MAEQYYYKTRYRKFDKWHNKIYQSWSARYYTHVYNNWY